MVALDDAAPVGDPTQDPTEAVVSLEAARAVREAVGALPERHRDALLLALAGMTPAQVGERMGIGRNAADALLHRARRSLKDRLRAAGEGVFGLAALVALKIREAGRRAGMQVGMIEAGSGAFGGSVAAAAAAIVLAVNFAAPLERAAAGGRGYLSQAPVAAGRADGGAGASIAATTGTPGGTQLTSGAIESGYRGDPLGRNGGASVVVPNPDETSPTPHRRLLGVDYEVWDDGQPHEGPVGEETDAVSDTTCRTSPESCDKLREGIGGL